MSTITKISTIIIITIVSMTANSATLTFQDSHIGIPPGTIFSQAISISDLGDDETLGAFDFDINFDPSVLRINRVLINEGPLNSQLDLFGIDHDLNFFSGYSQNTPSSVNLFEVSLDLTTDLIDLQEKNFILAVILFEAIGGPGSISNLSFTPNVFVDADGNPLDSLTVSGARVVLTPIPTTVLLFTPAVMLLLKLPRKKQLSV